MKTRPFVQPARGLALALGLATATVTALLAGCALPLTVFEGRYPMTDGWHAATVVRTVSDADLHPLLRPACADADAGAAAKAATAATPARTDGVPQWVVVRYSDAGRARRAAVPLSAGQAPLPGSLVYARVQGCARALAPRAAAG